VGTTVMWRNSVKVQYRIEKKLHETIGVSGRLGVNFAENNTRRERKDLALSLVPSLRDSLNCIVTCASRFKRLCAAVRLTVQVRTT
jgi:hypothetical protein